MVKQFRKILRTVKLRRPIIRLKKGGLGRAETVSFMNDRSGEYLSAASAAVLVFLRIFLG